MDIKETAAKLPQMLKKYKYPLLILLVGLVLMLWPEKASTAAPAEAPVQTQAQEDLAQQLEQILAQIRGVGKVKVLLTQSAGEQYLYQHDQDADGDSTKSDTVIITDGDRNQSPIVSQVLPPTYLGAVIVCQGAADPQIQLAVVEAVSRLTGLGADRISVLKMK